MLPLGFAGETPGNRYATSEGATRLALPHTPAPVNLVYTRQDCIVHAVRGEDWASCLNKEL